MQIDIIMKRFILLMKSQKVEISKILIFDKPLRLLYTLSVLPVSNQIILKYYPIVLLIASGY